MELPHGGPGPTRRFTVLSSALGERHPPPTGSGPPPAAAAWAAAAPLPVTAVFLVPARAAEPCGSGTAAQCATRRERVRTGGERGEDG